MATHEAMSIDITETQFLSEFGNSPISRNIVERFAECLQELQNATNERARLEASLRQASLGRFIQESLKGVNEA